MNATDQLCLLNTCSIVCSQITWAGNMTYTLDSHRYCKIRVREILTCLYLYLLKWYFRFCISDTLLKSYSPISFLFVLIYWLGNLTFYMWLELCFFGGDRWSKLMFFRDWHVQTSPKELEMKVHSWASVTQSSSHRTHTFKKSRGQWLLEHTVKETTSS